MAKITLFSKTISDQFLINNLQSVIHTPGNSMDDTMSNQHFMELHLVRSWSTFGILDFQVKYLTIGPFKSVQIWVAFWQPGIKPPAVSSLNFAHVAAEDVAMVARNGNHDGALNLMFTLFNYFSPH
jgi:hypothetical protein